MLFVTAPPCPTTLHLPEAAPRQRIRKPEWDGQEASRHRMCIKCKVAKASWGTPREDCKVVLVVVCEGCQEGWGGVG